MKRAQVIIEVSRYGHRIESEWEQYDTIKWLEVARWTEDLPLDLTLYNECYFCSCCGEVWARRRWYVHQEPDGLNYDQPRGWWINIKEHDTSPFSFYDFPAALHGANPKVWETLTNEFLDNPTIAGYTSTSFPCSSSGNPSDRRSRLREDG